MKKLILFILLFVTLKVSAQQTYWTASPPKSQSYTQSTRIDTAAGIPDSLRNHYFSNGNKWNLYYTAAQANARFTATAPITTLNNGLTLSGTTGKLGGTLSSSTHISTNGWPFFIQDASTDLQFLFSTPGNQVTLQSQSNGVGVDVLSGGTYGRSYLRYVTGGGDSTYFGVNVNNSTGHGGLIVADQVWNVGPIADASIDTAKISLNPKAYVTNEWVIGHLGTGSGFALTDGSGTTANGTAVDLGGSVSGNINENIGANSIDWSGNNGTWALDLLWDNTPGGSLISLQAANSTGSHSSTLNISAQPGSEYVELASNNGGTGSYIHLDRSTGISTITDGTSSLGAQYTGDYTTNQRLQRLSIPSVNTVIALADSVKATISGGGTTTNPLTQGNGINTFSFDGGTSGIHISLDTSVAVSKTFAGRYVKTNTAASLTSLSLSGTAGAGFMDLIAQSSDPTTPATGHNIIFADASGRFTVKGSNGFDWTVSKSLLTANRVQLVPDSAGTYALESRIIPNASLQNSSITINGNSVSLGASTTVTASTTALLTMNNGGSGAASGTTFDGGTARTISYNTIGASPTAGSASLTTIGAIGTSPYTIAGIIHNSVTTGAFTSDLIRTVDLGSSLSLTTPALGVATATSINGNAFTTGTYTITGGAGKTLTFNNTLTITNTDGITMTTPTTSFTAARTDAANNFTGTQTFSNITNTSTYTLNRTNITTSLSNAVQIYNTSVATVGSQVQNSPLIEFKANGWNTTPTAATNVMLAGVLLEPVAGATVSSNLNMYFNDNGGGYTKRYSFGNTGNLTMTTGTLILHGYTVSTLPIGVTGMTAYVTDALTPSFGTTLVGGGAIVTKAFYNGTNWIAE